MIAVLGLAGFVADELPLRIELRLAGQSRPHRLALGVDRPRYSTEAKPRRVPRTTGRKLMSRKPVGLSTAVGLPPQVAVVGVSMRTLTVCIFLFIWTSGRAGEGGSPGFRRLRGDG